MPVGYLQRFLARIRVLRALRRNDAWRIIVLRDKWLCPFCGRIGAEGLRASERLEDRILGHLSRCRPDWGSNGDHSLPFNELMAKAEAIREKAQVEDRLRANPYWRHHDLDGTWYCPFCAEPTDVILGGDDPTPDVAEGVFRHLTNCKDYRRGPDNFRSADQLRRVVEAADQRIRARRVEIVEEWESSLREAKRRQMQMLPEAPTVEGYAFACIYRPCATVSGDFYDFIPIDQDRLGFAVGDVSGHGMEAALVAGVAKKLLDIHGRRTTSPAKVLKLANSDIYSDLGKISFVSIAYGVLDLPGRFIRFARAGHTPLLLVNPRRTPPIRIVNPPGMIVGADGGTKFNATLEEIRLALQPGDVLVQTTDGVIERMDSDREQFGLARLCDVVLTNADADAETIGRRIEEATGDWADSAEADDDVTILVMRVLEEGEAR